MLILESIMLDILVTIFMLLIICVLILFLYRSIKKENFRYYNENIREIDGIKSKRDFVSDVSDTIARFGNIARFSLMKVSTEGLENINEKYGIKDGDRTIQEICTRMLKIVPEKSVIGRTDNTEFTIWIKNILSLDQITVLAEDIIESIERPIAVQNGEVNVECKIGIVKFPDHGFNYKTLITNLNTACYVAIKDTGAKFAIFSEKIKDEEAENAKYFLELKDAIKREQFTLYYQPIVSLTKKKIVAVESLLRWNHPTLGVLGPHEFIDVLEKSGDINWVGFWGIQELIKKQQEFKKTIPNFDVVFTFNLSPKQLQSPTIVDEFRKILRKFNQNPETICLEIVEFAMFQKYGIILENVEKLKELGFKIAIDDLGLEYATLSKLDKMPIDYIKLDKSFISQAKENFMNVKITEMLIDITKDKQIKIVAEAIENEEMISYVRNLGINLVQGYCFSSPVNSQDIKQLILKNNYKEIIDSTEKIKASTE